ncbi:hypothetical protein M3Y94_00075000 [Aphelenchoides besseyi]|nr:hypothetical protein M3Y94_00075000 [Aphelenchoides besseyi]
MKVLLLVVLVVCSIFSFVNAGYGPPVLPQPYGGYGSQGGFGGSSFGGRISGWTVWWRSIRSRRLRSKTLNALMNVKSPRSNSQTSTIFNFSL